MAKNVKGGRGGGAAKGNSILTEKDLEDIGDIISHRLDKFEEKLDNLQTAVEKCVPAPLFQKAKCAIRLNKYEIDNNNQYSRRENIRIHGFASSGQSALKSELLTMFNHIAQLDAKCVEIEKVTGKPLKLRKSKDKKGKSTPNSNVNASDRSGDSVEDIILKHLNTDGSIDESLLSVLEENLDSDISPFDVSDISTCHAANSSKSQFLVRFVSRVPIRLLFSLKSRVSLSATYSGVFITEDLSPLRMKLLNYIKENKAVSKVHTRDGNIHCTFNSNHYTISSPEDLFKLDMEVDYARLGLQAFE